MTGEIIALVTGACGVGTNNNSKRKRHGDTPEAAKGVLKTM